MVERSDRRNDEAGRLRRELLLCDDAEEEEEEEEEEEYDSKLLMRVYAYLMCEKQQMKRAEVIAHVRKRSTARRVLRDALCVRSDNDNVHSTSASSTDVDERRRFRSRDTNHVKRVSAALAVVCGGESRLSQLPEEEDMDILKDGLNGVMKEGGCARLRAAVLEAMRRFLLRSKTSGDSYVRESARIARWKERAPSDAANAANAAHRACMSTFRAMLSFLSWLENETIAAMRCTRCGDGCAARDTCDDVQEKPQKDEEKTEEMDAKNGGLVESVHYERRILAVCVYEAMLVAGVTAKQIKTPWMLVMPSDTEQHAEEMCANSATSAAEAVAAATILELASDTHDSVRSIALRCLEFFEYPLPCLADVNAVQAYVDAGFARMRSDKAREAEQGVEMVALIYTKYVMKLEGWSMRLVASSSSSSSSSPHADDSSGMRSHQRWRIVVHTVPPTETADASHVSLFEDLLQCVASEVAIESAADADDDRERVEKIGNRHIETSTTMTPLHGILQLVRRIVASSGTLWTSRSQHQKNETSASVTTAIQDLLRVVQTVMRVVVDVMGRPEALGMGADDVVACENEEDELVLGEPQRIISISWNAMKECFMCIATAAECSLPVARADAHERLTDVSSPAGMLDVAFVDIGNVMLDTLLVMKHNGALDYAYRGLASLGEAMLRCGGNLALEPARWLERTLVRMQRDEQTRQDVVRRSAGFPFALLAVFVAERDAAAPCLRGKTASRRLRSDISGNGAQYTPARADKQGMDKAQGHHRTPAPSPPSSALLDDGMHALLDIAAAVTSSTTTTTASLVDYEADDGIRDAAPRIHAFNALHKICTCRKLATCTGGFLEDVYRICVDANAKCRVREVRVAAMLAFAGLLERMVGYKNLPSTQQEWGAARAMSDVRFFRRFPKMHAYMLSEMDTMLCILEAEHTHTSVATSATTCTAAVNALVMHLALIGRLEPRPDGSLHAFAPLVARCANLDIPSITRMAARCPV